MTSKKVLWYTQRRDATCPEFGDELNWPHHGCGYRRMVRVLDLPASLLAAAKLDSSDPKSFSKVYLTLLTLLLIGCLSDVRRMSHCHNTTLCPEPKQLKSDWSDPKSLLKILYAFRTGCPSVKYHCCVRSPTSSSLIGQIQNLCWRCRYILSRPPVRVSLLAGVHFRFLFFSSFSSTIYLPTCPPSESIQIFPKFFNIYFAWLTFQKN